MPDPTPPRDPTGTNPDATGYAPLRALLADRRCAIRSFVVEHRGRIVFEHHRHDIPADSQQPVNSVTKSVVGMLVGIALHDGKLGNLDDPIARYLPEVTAPGVATAVRAITLRHLLTMTSGFAWNEKIPDPCLLRACERFAGGDRLAFILSRPMAHAPGTHFEYDSYASHLLTLILSRVVGMSLDRYAQARLFAPLDMAPPVWDVDETGIPFGGRGLSLTARDMLKLGQVMHRHGNWNGRQILPADYVAASIRPRHQGKLPQDRQTAGYGYLWWLEAGQADDPTFYAAGYGEQFILVDRRLDLVGAITANHTKGRKHVWRYWKEYVCATVAHAAADPA